MGIWKKIIDDRPKIVKKSRELFLNNRFAKIEELEGDEFDEGCRGTLRVFRSSPESIIIQVRAQGRVGKSGKQRNFMGNCSINKNQIEALILKLKEYLKEIQ